MNETEEKRKATFLKKMTDILNLGALNLAMGIGYRTGLFEALDYFDTPRTVSQIAEKAGLNKRYVKEWLGVMATGGIVEHSEGRDRKDLFFLPKAHGDFLAERSGNSNMGVYTQEIPLLAACAMEPVLNAFRTGVGVEYEKYPRFQDFMGQLADAKHRQVLVDTFLPSVDDGSLIKRLEKGIRVCDLGCAEGVAMNLMAQAFPKSSFLGIDISDESLAAARKEADNLGLCNVQYRRLDASTLEGDIDLMDSFDYVTAFDAIHDQTRPMQALNGVHSILIDGGLFSMVDIDASTELSGNMEHPMAPFLYTVSLMHCMPVGLVDGGAGLGMMWGKEKAVEMLREAGFSSVEVLQIPEDTFNLHFLCRK
jgi:ubiquinone/menaquinone biosynthesis C-methylase UbiE